MDGNIKLHTKAKGRFSMDWIHLANSADKWRGVVNTVLNFRFLQNARNFLTRPVSASREYSAVCSY